MDQLIYSVQIVIAILLGASLGWQRARWGKSAGPRTYALVTAGSALFTILSNHIVFWGGNTMAVNIAAGIVTGIGFLGIGLIFHKENHVEGLTTAAGLWMAAAIGMAVGLSLYVLAGITTLLIFFLFMLSDDKLHPKQQ